MEVRGEETLRKNQGEGLRVCIWEAEVLGSKVWVLHNNYRVAVMETFSYCVRTLCNRT